MRCWVVFVLIALLPGCAGPWDFNHYNGETAVDIAAVGQTYAARWPTQVHRQGLFSIDAGDANDWAIDPAIKLLRGEDGSAVWIYQLYGNPYELGTALATATSRVPIALKPEFLWYDNLAAPTVVMLSHSIEPGATSSQGTLTLLNKSQRFEPTHHEMIDMDYYRDRPQERPHFDAETENRIFAALEYVMCWGSSWKDAPALATLARSSSVALTVGELNGVGKYCEPNPRNSINPLGKPSWSLRYAGGGRWTDTDNPTHSRRAFHRLEDDASTQWPPGDAFREQHEVLAGYVKRIEIGGAVFNVPPLPRSGAIALAHPNGDLYVIGKLGGGPLDTLPRRLPR